MEVIRLLLQAGADPHVRRDDGAMPRDMTDDAEIKRLLTVA